MACAGANRLALPDTGSQGSVDLDSVAAGPTADLFGRRVGDRVVQEVTAHPFAKDIRVYNRSQQASRWTWFDGMRWMNRCDNTADAPR